MPGPTPNWEDRIGRRFKLRDLYILFTVVQWGSMAKGAVHLGMSQPAVSEAITRLEDALNVRLLDRLSRRYPKISVHVVVAQPGEQEFHELRERSVDLLLGRLFKPLSDDDVSAEILCQDAF